MADDVAISPLPPLMDMSGAGVDPVAHVACFSNALEGQFFNPTAHAGGRSDHHSLASSPFLASFTQYGGQLHHGMSLVQLLESNGYGGLVDMAGAKQQPACKGERERLSVSQDTGLTSDVNPEISSSSGQKYGHEAALWSY